MGYLDLEHYKSFRTSGNELKIVIILLDSYNLSLSPDFLLTN